MDRQNPKTFYLAAFGDPGHAFPMIALGSGLVTRGHRVCCETWPRWAADVRALGMEFVEAQEYSLLAGGGGSGFEPYQSLAGAVGPCSEAINAARPDLVVHDVLTMAPALAAEMLGIRRATLIPHLYPVTAPGFPPFGAGALPLNRSFMSRAFWEPVRRVTAVGLEVGRSQLNAVRAELGLDACEHVFGGMSGDLCLVATFPALEYPRVWPSHVHVVGPLLWGPSPDTQATCAPLVPPSDQTPLVLVAPSTAQDPDGRLLSSAVNGLASLPVRVLAVTNHRPVGPDVVVGANTRLVDWLSYADAMSVCDLVITHAGHGTLAWALAAGVPVLAVPHGGDMPENAARVAWAGAGLRLPWRFVGAASVRGATRLMLSRLDSFSTAAGEIAAWSASHDPVARACELVEDLAGRG